MANGDVFPCMRRSARITPAERERGLMAQARQQWQLAAEVCLMASTDAGFTGVQGRRNDQLARLQGFHLGMKSYRYR